MGIEVTATGSSSGLEYYFTSNQHPSEAVFTVSSAFDFTNAEVDALHDLLKEAFEARLTEINPPPSVVTAQVVIRYSAEDITSEVD